MHYKYTKTILILLRITLFIYYLYIYCSILNQTILKINCMNMNIHIHDTLQYSILVLNYSCAAMMCNNGWMNESWSWYRCCVSEFLCSVLSLPFIFLTSSLSLIRTLCEIIIGFVHMHMHMHVLCIRFLFVFLFLIYLCFHHTSYITYSNSLLLSLGSLFITINYQLSNS